MIDTLFHTCAQKNETIKNRSQSSVSMRQYLAFEKARCESNSIGDSMNADIDFINISDSYVKKLLGQEAANAVSKALSKGAIATADHHGALYCAQSFQGDILFSELIKSMGYDGAYIPIFSTGIVELENSAYARGICVYTDAKSKQFFPFFPAKDSVRLACAAIGIDSVLVDRAVNRIQKETSGEQRDVLVDLCNDIYRSEDIASCTSFSWQTTKAGVALCRKLFGENGPFFVYIQLEDIVKELLKKELEDADSLVSHILFDERVVDNLGELAEHLFIAVDEKGRKISLTLSAGVLTGKDWHKEQVEYEATWDNILALLEEGVLWPDTLLSVAVLFFERRITWYGGIFQSVYLPKWQQMLCDVLDKAGYQDESKTISKLDCGGYISGPAFAMYKKNDFAVCAGPVECLLTHTNYEQLTASLDNLNMYEAHIRGLCEIYFDLVYRNEREEDWYEKIGLYNGAKCRS